MTVTSRTGKLKVRSSSPSTSGPTAWASCTGSGRRWAAWRPGAGVCDNVLIPDAGSHLDWQDLIGGEAHVSTRVRITR